MGLRFFDLSFQLLIPDKLGGRHSLGERLPRTAEGVRLAQAEETRGLVSGHFAGSRRVSEDGAGHRSPA
jgi:hypothetical protein